MLPVHAKFVHLPHRRKPTNIWSVTLTQTTSVSSTFRRPSDTAQFRRKLGWVGWVEKFLIQLFARFQFFFGRANDQPKDLRIGIIENLAQQFRPDENTAMFWHRNCLLADPHASDAFDDKIKFLHFGMAMECVGAFGWETPEPRAENLAFGALQKIGIWNFHHVGGPPEKFLWFDDEKVFDRCHMVAANAKAQWDGVQCVHICE